MAKDPELIATGVYRLDATGRSNSISVLLVADGDGWALVDTGVQGSSLPIQDRSLAVAASKRLTPPEPGEGLEPFPIPKGTVF